MLKLNSNFTFFAKNIEWWPFLVSLGKEGTQRVSFRFFSFLFVSFRFFSFLFVSFRFFSDKSCAYKRKDNNSYLLRLRREKSSMRSKGYRLRIGRDTTTSIFIFGSIFIFVSRDRHASYMGPTKIFEKPEFLLPLYSIISSRIF